MTGPRFYDDLPPAVEVDPIVRGTAGAAVRVTATITNRAHEPRIMALTALGVDAGWLPRPDRSKPLLPGESAQVTLTFVPAVGTLPAQYPLALTVQAINPASGDAMSNAALGNITLVVDAPGQIELGVDPPEASGRFGRRITVNVHNSGVVAEEVLLEVNSPEAARVRLRHYTVTVGAGASIAVPGRINIEARLFGNRYRFTYTISARGSGAPRRFDGAVVTRAFLGATGPKVFAMIAFVSLWAAVALVFIPKLSSTIQGAQTKAENALGSASATAEHKGGSALPKNRKSGGASGGHGSGGANGAGGSSNSATATGKVVQLSGTVMGAAPSGVQVAMRPTSLVDAQSVNARTVGVNTVASTMIGKIPQSAVLLSSPTTQQQTRSTTTQGDGAWSFARVRAPGYYLLTFTKPGYQTQRYVVDSAAAVAANPLTVTLTAGQGRLSGKIATTAGPVGGATVRITDGINTVTTSSNSKGNVGYWSVDGLSTPSSYLVSATKDGLSTESAIINLAAGGTAVSNLTLKYAATTLVGNVLGTQDNQTSPVGVVNAQVAVTKGSQTRSATTITDGNLAGQYRLPGLSPGTYSVTTSAVGYLTQTQRVSIRTGQSSAKITSRLTSASATVSGLVTGPQFTSDGSVRTTTDGAPVTGPVVGAGIMLTSSTNSYKITSGADGRFVVNGVAPGTYVLSAQFSGLTTAFVTVVAVAGQSVLVPTASLDLGVGGSANTSSITGYVTSAANPNGTLTCPTGTTRGVDCKVTLTLTDSSGESVPTTTDNDPPTASPTLAPAESGPTGYTLSAVPGLPAGLYRLTITATGYLPAIVSVRVPEQAIAVAPQVNLFATNTIQGSITALGDPSTYGPAAGVPYVTCAYAVPVTSTDKPPTACDFTPPAVSVCQTKALSETGYAVIDDATLSYKIGGLCDGDYSIYIITANPWYVPLEGTTSLSLTHGQTAVSTLHLPRKGRALLNLSLIDPDSGNSGAVSGGITGSATCGKTSSGDLTKLDGSVVTVAGVDASNDVTCTVNATSSSGAPLTGRVVGLSATNDNDTLADLALTQQVGTVYGQLVSAYGSSSANPVANATVTLTGTVATATGASPATRTTTVVTDSHGCFAITPDGAAPAPGAGTCGSLDAPATDHTAALDLVARPVTVSASPGSGLRDYDGTVKFNGGVTNTITVTPSPVPVTAATTLTAAGTGAPDLSQALITATPIAAVGSGTITVTANPDGTLNWQDSKYGALNQSWPGTYHLTATLAGYQSASVELDCTFNTAACTSAGAFRLVQQGYLYGTLIGYQGTNSVDYPSNALSGATITATRCDPNAAGCSPTSTVLTATSDQSGYFMISTASTPSMALGSWKISVTARGYDDYDQIVTINSGANSLDGQYRNYSFTTPVTLRVGIQISDATLYQCPAANPHCATVSLYRPGTPAIAPVDTQAADGRYVFANLNPAVYSITISGDGVTQTTTQYTVQLGSGTTNFDVPVALIRNTISGSVQGAKGKGGDLTALNGIPVELGHLDGGGNFVTDDNTNGKPLATTTMSNAGVPGTFVFGNVPNGSYIARYNTGAASVDGYFSAVVSSLASVSGGQSSTYAQITLTRVTHNVVVPITTTASDDDISAVTATLTSASDPTWILSTTATPGPGAKTQTLTFLAVTYGSWQLAVSLPAGHLGHLNATASVALNCTAGTVTTTVSCTTTNAAPLVVPGSSAGDPSTPVTASFTLDEYQLEFSLVATRLAADPAGSPDPVDVKVTDSSSQVVYTNATFPVSFSSPAASSVTFWGGGGLQYTTKTTAPANWTPTERTLTSTAPTATILLTEQGATVTLTLTGTSYTGNATVTLVSPGNGIVAPAAKQVAAGATATFSDVPYASGWEASASATHTAPNPNPPPPTITTPISGSKIFAVNGSAESVSVSLAP